MNIIKQSDINKQPFYKQLIGNFKTQNCKNKQLLELGSQVAYKKQSVQFQIQ